MKAEEKSVLSHNIDCICTLDASGDGGNSGESRGRVATLKPVCSQPGVSVTLKLYNTSGTGS